MAPKFSAIIFLILALISFPGQTQVTKIPDSLTAVGDFTNASTAYSRIITDSIRISELDLGNSFMRRGNCLVNMEKPREAIIDYFSALRIFEKLRNDERACVAYSNLGNSYDKLNELAKALDYYHKAIDISTKLNDATRNADLLNDIGVIEYKMGNREPAIQLHLTALDKYKDDLSEETICKHYINLGNCYAEKDNDSSLYYYKRAEAIAQKIKDSFSLAGIYLNIGDLEKQKNNYKEALSYLDRSLVLNSDYGDSADLSIVYHNLADVYDSLHDYEKAYRYSQKEKELNDILFSIEKSKFATELSEKYESDKKDEKIETQARENRLKERNLLLSFIGLALVLALGIISFVSYRRKKKANVVLQQQNERIEKLNKELDASNQVKSKLFSVIGHDIRGPISSIYAYLQMHNNTAASDQNIKVSKLAEQLLDTLEDLLIWSKSQLHQFTASFEKIQLINLVEQVAGLLQTAIVKKELKFENKVSQHIMLNTDLNMLTIIIRNILSNSINYAVPGSTIIVQASTLEDSVEISFNNKALQKDISTLVNNKTNIISSDPSGLGTKLIMEFTQKLNGTIRYEVIDDHIISVVRFPNT